MQYLKSFSHLRSLALLLIFILFIAVTGYAQQNVTLRGQLNPFPGGLRYADVWGEGNYAYLASFGSGTGVIIIDISNPASPVMVGHYNPSAGGLFQDVIVQKGIGYFSSDNLGGVHIVDVRQPSQPMLLSRITVAEQGFASVHELALSDNLLYEAASGRTVVKVFNVENPAAPVFLRDIQTTDTNFIHAVTVINGRLYTSGWGGRTDIFDVSRIRSEAPVLLGTVDSGSTSHSSWVSSDGRLMVSARETTNGDVRVFDISNPATPVLRSTISLPQTIPLEAISPHNPYLVGHLLFVSWYQVGLLIFDLSDPANPQRVGWYDTFVGGVTGFQGNWGVYPFLGLDRVLLSDTNNGLFVVDATSSTPLPRTVSAASFLPGAVAAKSVVAAFGVGLTSMTAQAGTVPLPTTLGSTSVRVVDARGVERLAPLFFVSPIQINYQIPAGTAEGPASVVVTGSDGQVSRGVTIVLPTAPAVFTIAQNGEGPAAALDGFTSEGAPFAATRPNGLPNIIAVYLAGLGDDATDVDNNVAASVEALIDGIPVSVDYAGRAPGFVGLNQLNLTLPVGVSSGAHSLVVKRGGFASRPVTLQIK